MLAVMVAAFVAAGDPSSAATHLAKGRQLLTALEYESAAMELMTAATAPDASDDVRVEANLYAGVANRVIGKDADARLNFRYVLLRAPQTKVPAELGPKVQLYFEAIRQEIDAERANGAALAAPAAAPIATPAPTPTAPSTPVAVYAGAVTCAAGALGLVVGGVGVAFAETSLADPDRDGSERKALRGLGQWSTASAVGGALFAVVGGVILGVAAAP